MESGFLLRKFKEMHEDRLLINVVNEFKSYMTENDVLNALCSKSVESISLQLRIELIRTLQLKSEAANQWFIDCVLSSPNSSYRRWALINLSLMQCRKAKEAVLKGLKDHSRKVRIAAAFNVGLYYDDEVIKALENYFETEEIDFPLDIITDEIKNQKREPKIKFSDNNY